MMNGHSNIGPAVRVCAAERLTVKSDSEQIALYVSEFHFDRMQCTFLLMLTEETKELSENRIDIPIITAT